MTVFVCTACGAALTERLERLKTLPGRPPFEARFESGDGSRRAPATVARGYYALDPEPWGPPFVPTDDAEAIFPGGPCVGDPDGDGFLVSAGPRDTIVLHPEDAPVLQYSPKPDDAGCCGLTGRAGFNMRCPCGTDVGTEISECYTAYELHLVPDLVHARPAPPS
ncbi:hypothetical protein [Actinomadura rugatobispora]|uniref:DUF1963 domain-containing protein n=1 Tax=Actinomadura rugatobispora TaxID=1994 RepID=A0ABW1A987_9ACTN|nr:hypothetical protein GCM10010200_018290 [Actinomadura rugatobispora]